ncbi:AIPR family protein [Bradyrhizobium genosp. P]|uniref:AIPR family protein n=1 Tax=Bradyrhizobium genosp. P TaxID=83641 RepID=UPI003CEEF300
MTSPKSGKHAPNRVRLNYQIVRNTTSPDEKELGVQSFVVNLPAWEILKLNTKENLRAYLAEYNPRKRNRVHDAIRDTIVNEPQRFIVRNSGFVITAAAITVDDNGKYISLLDPSIINGAQSQGEIKAYHDELVETEGFDEDEEPLFYVRASIIVDPDASEVTETAIARNIATPIKSLTEAGARHQLDDLEKSIRRVLPGAKIRKAESDDEDVIDTRRVLQLTRLLMPSSVSGNYSAAEKLRAYKNPEQCLTNFCTWHDDKKTDAAARAKYDFTVQIAPYALQEYRKWETHPAWNGHQIWGETKKGGRAVRRDDTNKVAWVSPGIIFPLLAAQSEFAVKDAGGQWSLKKPSRFREEEMVLRTVNQFRAHNSDPMVMGRSEAAYDALRIYPQTLVEVLRELQSGK